MLLLSSESSVGSPSPEKSLQTIHSLSPSPSLTSFLPFLVHWHYGCSSDPLGVLHPQTSPPALPSSLPRCHLFSEIFPNSTTLLKVATLTPSPPYPFFFPQYLSHFNILCNCPIMFLSISSFQNISSMCFVLFPNIATCRMRPRRAEARHAYLLEECLHSLNTQLLSS